MQCISSPVFLGWGCNPTSLSLSEFSSRSCHSKALYMQQSLSFLLLAYLTSNLKNEQVFKEWVFLPFFWFLFKNQEHLHKTHGNSKSLLLYYNSTDVKISLRPLLHSAGGKAAFVNMQKIGISWYQPQSSCVLCTVGTVNKASKGVLKLQYIPKL